MLAKRSGIEKFVAWGLVAPDRNFEKGGAQ